MPETRAATLLAGDDPAWCEFVSGNAGAHPFHHPAWAATIADAYGFEPLVVAIRSENGAILGGLPLVQLGGRLRAPRWVSFPFTDRCPPLLGSGMSDAELGAAVAELGLRRGVPSVEIRAPLAGFESSGVPFGVTHTLALTDPDTLFRGFRSQVQRNIRKAEASAVTVRAAEARDDLTRVYFALHTQTRRRLGVPPQPRRFFEALWPRLVDDGLGFVLLAYHEGVAVAGAVFLEWNGRIVYKYGASDRRHWHLRPNNLLFWECIRRGCDAGATILDFGRSDSGNRGLRAFKQSWGAPETPLVYTTLGRRQRVGGEVVERLIRPFVRTAPTWVGRRLGEAFYRFAA